MMWEVAKTLLCAIALIWTVGSIVIACLRPWRKFEREDRWLAWALTDAWLPAVLWIAGELLVEWWLDRRDARRGRARRGG